MSMASGVNTIPSLERSAPALGTTSALATFSRRWQNVAFREWCPGAHRAAWRFCTSHANRPKAAACAQLNVYAFRDREGIFHLDTKIAHGAAKLHMAPRILRICEQLKSKLALRFIGRQQAIQER
jgi:hypothetical protein